MARSTKVRIQLDMGADEARLLDALRERLSLRSRADVVRTALAVVEWVDHETASGRRVLAVGQEDISYLALPGITTTTR